MASLEKPDLKLECPNVWLYHLVNACVWQGLRSSQSFPGSPPYASAFAPLSLIKIHISTCQSPLVCELLWEETDSISQCLECSWVPVSISWIKDKKIIFFKIPIASPSQILFIYTGLKMVPFFTWFWRPPGSKCFQETACQRLKNSIGFPH